MAARGVWAAQLGLPLAAEEERELTELAARIDALARGPPRETPRKRSLAEIEARCGATLRVRAEASEEERTRALLATTHLFLDRFALARLDHLALFSELTHLYVQHNALESLEGLEASARLQVLCVRGNKLRRLGALAHLAALRTLDCADNLIEQLSDAELRALPASLRSLALAGNPVADAPGLRERVAAAAPQIELLDEEPLLRARDPAPPAENGRLL